MRRGNGDLLLLYQLAILIRLQLTPHTLFLISPLVVTDNPSTLRLPHAHLVFLRVEAELDVGSLVTRDVESWLRVLGPDHGGATGDHEWVGRGCGVRGGVVHVKHELQERMTSIISTFSYHHFKHFVAW